MTRICNRMRRYVMSNRGKTSVGSIALLALFTVILVVFMFVRSDKSGSEKTLGKVASGAVSETSTTLSYYTQAYASSIDRRYEISHESCNSISGFEALDCYTELAIREGNVNVCSALTEMASYDACVRHYSVQYPEGCSLFKNDTTRAYECYKDVMSKRNISIDEVTDLCERLEDYEPLYLRSMCLMNNILTHGQDNMEEALGLCDRMGEEGLGYYCKAMVNRDESYCDGIVGGPDVAWKRDLCVDCATKDWYGCRIYYNRDEERFW
ncbi:MAG: hypothetical protein ABIH11_02990 [Candidatus Altiarchaeota archaeon]